MRDNKAVVWHDASQKPGTPEMMKIQSGEGNEGREGE